MAKQKTERQKRKAAKLMAAGFPIKDSLVAAGWSAKQAAKGREALGKDLKKMLDEEKKKRSEYLSNLGAAYTPDERRQMARGALVDNVLTGQDKAVHSIKLMGQDQETAMWERESEVGIVLAFPKNLTLPTIRHEPLPEPEED